MVGMLGLGLEEEGMVMVVGEGEEVGLYSGRVRWRGSVNVRII